MAFRFPLPLTNWQEPRIRTLHFTWMAFFITFLIWFAHVSLMPMIKETMHLTDAQVKAFLILNVALTIPARILIGILVDKYGPRRSYSLLLLICGFLCLGFAAAQTFEQLAVMRFLLGFTGAAVPQVRAVLRRVELVVEGHPEAATYTPGAIL